MFEYFAKHMSSNFGDLEQCTVPLRRLEYDLKWPALNYLSIHKHHYMVWYIWLFDRNNRFGPKSVKFKHSVHLKMWPMGSNNSFRRLKHAYKCPALNSLSIHMHHDMVWLMTKNGQIRPNCANLRPPCTPKNFIDEI